MQESSASTNNSLPNRRSFLEWVSYILGAIAGAALAIPVVGYFLGPALQRKPDEWVDLGSTSKFPESQTRMVTFTNPLRRPWDGMTAQTAAYVRRLQGETFQVFAVDCAHLGCPVSWFPESGLFMCPCHGGVYYEDGSHASGPPPRGLYEYDYQIKEGNLYIRAGHLPTLQDTLKSEV